MSIQTDVNIEPETVGPEPVAAIQQPSLNTSTDRQTIRVIVGALGIVDRLHGVFFDWKVDGKHDIGFIPEEVAEVLPEAVAFDENGKAAKAIDNVRLVAVLVEAVKEQQTQIKNHEHSLKEQKAQLAKLRSEIERLKTTTRAATVR
jgi:hypothetical protein